MHTDPIPDWEETDGFASLEEGMGAFVPEWDNDETTDLGRTRMRTPDSEQATRLHGRAFDELRKQGTPSQATPRPAAAPPPPESSGPWIAGMGVLGALIGVMIALVFAMVVLAWLSWRGGPRPATEPDPTEPTEPIEDPDDPAEPPPEPQPGSDPEHPPEPAPVVGGGFEARFPARFDFNEWTPRDVDEAALDLLVSQLETRCAGVIVLTGHTDGVGPDGVNERFAIARAATVRDVIASVSDIPKPRMVLASTIDEPESGEEGRRVELSCP